MSRSDETRLRDVLAALDAIDAHTTRGGLDDGLVFDAVRARLIEIGEAVKGLSDDVPSAAPGIPWSEVAGMRDFLAHRYFDASHAIVEHTVTRDLPELRRTVTGLLG